LTESAAEKLKKTTASEINPAECRAYFDTAIGRCPPGLVVLFGCSPNEEAGDSAVQGGYYSYNLLRAAKAWGEKTIVDTKKEREPLSVVQAHDMSIAGVMRMSAGKQTPTICKPRSGPYFPLAIIA
jgi:hypothetical protein